MRALPPVEDAEAPVVNLLDKQSTCSAIEVWEGARKVFPASPVRVDPEQVNQAKPSAEVVVAEERVRVLQLHFA